MYNNTTYFVKSKHRCYVIELHVVKAILGMAYHFGAEIRKVLKEKGMTVAEFARRINKSRENAYDIFRRKSLDMELLSAISEVLDYDFIAKSRIKKIRGEHAHEPRHGYGASEQEILLMREEMLVLRKEIIELKKLVAAMQGAKTRKKK